MTPLVTPERLAHPSEVAAYLDVALVTLAKWRQRGKGPKWIKAGTAVRYEWTEVRRWVEDGGDRAVTTSPPALNLRLRPDAERIGVPEVRQRLQLSDGRFL